MRLHHDSETDDAVIDLGHGDGAAAPWPDWVESRVDSRGRLSAIVIHKASEHLAPVLLVDEALLGTSEAAAFFDVRPSNFVRDLASRDDFPPPVASLASTRVWRRGDLRAYRERRRSSTSLTPASAGSKVLRRNARRGVSTVAIAAPAMRQEVRDLLPTIRRRLVSRFRPERIIVFGSQARGDATHHSDLDLLVVVSEGTDIKSATRDMYEVLDDLPIAKDIVVATLADIDRFGNLVGTILQPALREGVTIYERA
jgi:predicted nucleotidyltransferase